jgi:pentatricopeptide repeat protein
MPSKAIGIFEQMKREGVTPTVVTYSALISACEKGQQWRLALQVLEEMKAAGHGANVIAYSAAISALSKGQQWEKALELFREIEKNGGRPSVVTYNATMTALEKRCVPFYFINPLRHLSYETQLKYLMFPCFSLIDDQLGMGKSFRFV